MYIKKQQHIKSLEIKEVAADLESPAALAVAILQLEVEQGLTQWQKDQEQSLSH